MSDRSFKHHLSPQEIARRQRWVAVGVAVLAILLVGTWLVTLPSRISGYSPDHTWNAWWGKSPDTKYIDVNELMKEQNDSTKAVQEMLHALTASSTKAQVAATSTAMLSTSTLNILKQKIK